MASLADDSGDKDNPPTLGVSKKRGAASTGVGVGVRMELKRILAAVKAREIEPHYAQWYVNQVLVQLDETLDVLYEGDKVGQRAAMIRACGGYPKEIEHAISEVYSERGPNGGAPDSKRSQAVNEASKVLKRIKDGLAQDTLSPDEAQTRIIQLEKDLRAAVGFLDAEEWYDNHRTQMHEAMVARSIRMDAQKRRK